MGEGNITAAQLSKDLDINSSRFTQWKKGLQNPSAEAIVKIAKYFNVSTDYILCLTDDPTPPNKKTSDDFSSNNPELKELSDSHILDISVLSEDSREDLLKHFDVLKFRDEWKEYTNNRDEYIKKHAKPYAAFGGDTTNLSEARNAYDKAAEKMEKRNMEEDENR